MIKFNPMTEQYRKYLTETPKKGGRSYSQVYIKNVSYYVNKLKEPISIESINQFIKDQKLHPSIARALGMFMLWKTHGRIDVDKETKKKITDKLYVPPIKAKRFTHSQKVLNDEEVQKLFNLPIEWSAIFRFLFDTMLRKSEFLNVTVEDIDFKTNMVTLKKIKGGEPDIRFFNDTTKQALILYMAAKKIKKGKLFKFSESGFWSAVNRIGEQTLGRKFNPHWCRTSSAQLARDRGADDFSLMQLGGWKDRSTLDVYTKNSMATRKIAFEKFKKTATPE